MKRAIKGFPGLYREEYGTGGKRFRILINHKKKIIQEYFYVRIGTSEAKTKKLAVARWRELREKHPVITKRRFREIPRNPTSSKIIGVTRINHEVKGYEYEFWKAAWTTLRGKRCSRVFSVNKYGERKAKKLAVEARREALDKIGAE
jgi:hypothetical protein